MQPMLIIGRVCILAEILSKLFGKNEGKSKVKCSQLAL